MQNLFKKLLIIFLFTPSLVFAFKRTFDGLVKEIISLISSTIPVIISLTLLYFFWGLAQFILKAGGGKEREDAKNTMFWGIIALFVMVSVWGIVNLLQNSFIQ